MEKLEKYRNLIKAILTEYASDQPSFGEVRLFLTVHRVRSRLIEAR